MRFMCSFWDGDRRTTVSAGVWRRSNRAYAFHLVAIAEWVRELHSADTRGIFFSESLAAHTEVLRILLGSSIAQYCAQR